MPLEMMPAGLQTFSKFLPLTYVVKLLRGAWFGAPLSELWLPIAVLGVMLVVCGLLSAKYFKWE